MLSSSIDVIPEFPPHDTSQEPGTASDRSSHGNLDQGTPEQLGGRGVGDTSAFGGSTGGSFSDQLPGE
jgi:hypothetical protein